MQGAPPATEDSLIGIATPHVSPFGGWESYRDAYSMLPPSHQDRTFVVLGTSHYGEPDRFGLTHKPFVTPFGESMTDGRLVDELAEAAPEAVRMEDYCHAIEHSIEFQVLFLQYLVRPEHSHSADPVRVLRAQHLSRGQAGGERACRSDSSTVSATSRLGKGTSCCGSWASIWRTWAAATETR